MEHLSRSFRIEGRSLSEIRRSGSNSLLISESIPSESARFLSYEKLSESPRMDDEVDLEHRSRKSRAARFIVKVLTFRKLAGNSGTTQQAASKVPSQEEKQRRKRSSWLPDPERRWPVQGW
ncbi:hypothetical protein Tsubulata_014124 [Turnera subulata]|uniref:Uncharacterized protein n=1 Tax=Turnera subulata TaxID=218843 RepID=A0A9Q0GKH0_9ROSI|nr:hypothetical protein Tsubulata_014124 [Turnera subulata]